MFIYSVTSNGSRLAVSRIYAILIHDGDDANSDMGYRQACPNIVVVDFDGDGYDEAAFVGRTYESDMRVGIIKYNKDTKKWSYECDSFTQTQTACIATRADLDGDGKDEIVGLFFPERSAGVAHPRLERWYCEKGTIKPKRDKNTMKGGPGDTSVFGYAVTFTNGRYLIAEDFSITAGPLTGTYGKAKLVDDIAISHVDDDVSRVFVIPTKLDDSKNFSKFGDRQDVYNDSTANTGRKGALITGDFANGSLMLGTPQKTVDKHDQAFIVVVQAFPYHVDNVDTAGNLTAEPINYTFSDFDNDEDNGFLRIRYSNASSRAEDTSVSFGMASTTETIALLRGAGKYVHAYLKFNTVGANIIGNFDPRVKPVAGALNTVMDAITDTINKVTTNSTKNAYKASMRDDIIAQNSDRTVMYAAPQYIWRYKILNDPLPSWFKKGPRVDPMNGTVSADSREEYLTFSMYDTSNMVIGTSEANYSYNERHEEGNFFSYPVSVTGIEGYNPYGVLMPAPYTVAWSKSYSRRTLSFDKTSIEEQKYDENIKKSLLSKAITAAASYVGIDNPTGLPPYSSHNESFTKTYSTSEGIEMTVQGRSTLPDSAAGHTLSVMPYTTREGVMRIGTAVTLDLEYDAQALWSEGSIYRKYPDPALVLPHKYVRNGATLRANPRHSSASIMRGVCFYVPKIALDSDSQFVGGLTYQIRVPLYNASFLDTGEFDVRLSYVAKKDFKADTPRATMNNLKEIQTVTMSLGGWNNADSNANKGWAVFTWDVPETLPKGDYYFYVEVDPEQKLGEVHESRLSANGTVVDVGGNNEGYIGFHIIPPAEAEKLSSPSFKASATTLNPTPKGSVFRTVYRRGEKVAGSEDVNSAMSVYDKSGTLEVNVTFDTFEDIEILYFMSVLAELVDSISPDVFPYTIPVECSVEYNGSEYYPEVYFYGFNYKPGALASVSGDYSLLTDDDVGDSFLIENISLVPNTTNVYTIHINPRFIDWRNGAGFEIVVPELSVADVSGDASETDDDSGTADEAIGVGSSGGGCEAGVGLFAVLIFAGAVAFRAAKR
ncbi:MAG: hypothetical protein IKQ95_10585 [Synergistaceae bacterium]|nr:hypothetical protein [Synergistaceae bacterium]